MYISLATLQLKPCLSTGYGSRQYVVGTKKNETTKALLSLGSSACK